MTRTPPCCCDAKLPEECGYMFLRRKILGIEPVFSTPGISIWTNALKGYTGIDGGLSGCTFTEKLLEDGHKVRYYRNVGIRPENAIYESKLFANIPGDNFNYYGNPPKPLTPDESVFVFGAVVLPKAYEGITLNNTIIKNGKPFYQFVKGNIPPSIIGFIKLNGGDSICSSPAYTRDDYVAGGIAGDNYNTDVVLLPVFYSDTASKALKETKGTSVDLIYSLDSSADLPSGYFNQHVSPGCLPCRKRLPNEDVCYNAGPDTCGGIPFAYYQTIPESIEIYNLSLASCKNENNGDFISITDARFVNNFHIQKALVTSDHSCGPTVDCSNEKTRGKFKCCEAEDGIFNACPVNTIGRGFSRAIRKCDLYNIVPCDDPASCSRYACGDTGPDPLTDNRFPRGECLTTTWLAEIIYAKREETCTDADGNVYSYFENKYYYGPTWFSMDWWGSGYIPTKMPGTDIEYCGHVETDNSFGCKSRLEFYCDLVVVSQPGCGPEATITFDKFYISPAGESHQMVTIGPGAEFCSNEDPPGSAGCCCCGGADCFGTPPDLGNIMCSYEKDITTFAPNPYVMYTNNSNYFVVDADTNNVPDFSKYLRHYYNTWRKDRVALYPEVSGIQYDIFIANPVGSCSWLTPIPPMPYFLYSYVYPSPRTIDLIYDSDRCIFRIDKIQNPDLVCSEQFLIGSLGPKPSGPGVKVLTNLNTCTKNKKHGIPLKDVSFQFACTNKLACEDTPDCEDAYTKDVCWSYLTQHWNMTNIDHFGNCNGEGITLSIQMPVGLTLDDCTNILSWDVLKTVPKPSN